ncbi:MAG TPA: sigma-70 family RNA polymerase sigma factor [Thermoanaerobaculia bacterium]|nr:sigma-70 family RNA polymerase sigma factor [Thermoanaerobaculia bacterium]
MAGREAHELLTSNLAVIERAVSFASRRYRLDPNDAEEFASVVHLKFVENDYAILRAFEARSSFATYISIVIQRLALDYCIHVWGKWHASAEAKRLGSLAIELEQLLHRDGRTVDEALVILAPKHDGVTRESLQRIAGRLPERVPRHRDVGIEKAESVAVTRPSDVEEPLFANDRRRASESLSAIMSAVIARLPEDERLILQLRFEGGMTVPQIARSLGLDQRVTYRRIERRMRDIRTELERSGIAWRDVLDLIGRDEVLLQFDLGKQKPRPSIGADEKAPANTEGSQ